MNGEHLQGVLPSPCNVSSALFSKFINYKVIKERLGRKKLKSLRANLSFLPRSSHDREDSVHEYRKASECKYAIANDCTLDVVVSCRRN